MAFKSKNATRDYPVFIMGAERSGTSSIAYLLRSSFGYKGQTEGHVFNLLNALLRQVDSHFIHKGFSLERKSLLLQKRPEMTTAEIISAHNIKRELLATWCRLVSEQNSGLWYDKTPGPEFIRCAPTLYKMYPNARFIFLIREPGSSIQSNMRKFGSSFENAVNRWIECATAWLQVKSMLPQEAFIELQTDQLSSDASYCLDKIATLLAGHPLPVTASEIKNTPILRLERTSLDNMGASLSALVNRGIWSTEQERKSLDQCAALAAVFGLHESESLQKPKVASMVFPPPYGQEKVETVYGKHGGVWPQVHSGSVCIFLHPSIGEPATCITYRTVEFRSAGKLSLDAFLLPEACDSVKFELVVSDTQDRNHIRRAWCICAPGETRSIELLIAPAGFSADVSVTTTLLSGIIKNSWALISCPKFESEQ